MNELEQEVKSHMQKTIEHLKKELMNITDSRPSVSPIERIKVSCYGSMTPVKNIASITLGDKCVNIDVYDESNSSAVENAIKNADLGVSTKKDSKSIKVFFPDLDEQRVEKIMKVIKQTGENAKISIRNIRHNNINDLKSQEKNKIISEDDLKRSQDQIQKTTDEFNKKIDELIKIKTSYLK